MILVTGASGQIGKETIKALLTKIPAQKVVAMVRDLDKVSDLHHLGIEIRQGDYHDFNSLQKAFNGAEKIFLVSAHAFTDLTSQHINVIDAAKEAGVKHIVFTSIFRTEDAKHTIPWVTLSMKITEDYLRNSGLNYTILRNTFYSDNLPIYFGDVIDNEKLIIPGGQAEIAFATRADLAEASAVVLTESGHDRMTYTLCGTESTSFAHIAKTLSRISGKEIIYEDVSEESFIKKMTERGVPLSHATFWAEWLEAMKAGDMRGDENNTLELLLQRKPKNMEDFLSEIYTSQDLSGN